MTPSLRRLLPLSLALLLLPVLAPALLPVPSAVAAQMPGAWINEIHYDNVGSDTGEAIEVAGPAGTDLAGWSVVLYNGNGGAAYGTQSLSGALPDQAGGLGTASVPATGLQNGDPDGLALVDATGAVVQFLSYEGTFTAKDGPAAGRASTDIGVAENGTATGTSLQLTGTGRGPADFTWTGGPASFDAVNAGQIYGDPPPTEPTEPCTAPVTLTPIPEIQGSDHAQGRAAAHRARVGHRGRARSGRVLRAEPGR